MCVGADSAKGAQQVGGQDLRFPRGETAVWHMAAVDRTCNVHRDGHAREPDRETDHEPAEHEGQVPGGEGHHQRTDRENPARPHDRPPAAKPLGQLATGGRADDSADDRGGDHELQLLVRQPEVGAQQQRRAGHHSSVVAEEEAADGTGGGEVEQEALRSGVVWRRRRRRRRRGGGCSSEGGGLGCCS